MGGILILQEIKKVITRAYALCASRKYNLLKSLWLIFSRLLYTCTYMSGRIVSISMYSAVQKYESKLLHSNVKFAGPPFLKTHFFFYKIIIVSLS